MTPLCFSCPTCRAPWRSVDTCARCGTDLLPLMRLAARAHALREEARRALLDVAAERVPEALAAAREAHRLQRTPRSTALLGVALVAAGEREEALELLTRASRPSVQGPSLRGV